MLRDDTTSAHRPIGSCPQAGLDSLGAMELRNAVSAGFGVDSPATLAFDYPTAAALAGFIAEHTPAAAAPPAWKHAASRRSPHGQGWRAARGDGFGSSASGAESDPAPGPNRTAQDPRRLLDEVTAVVAEVLGRPIDTDLPLMEVLVVSPSGSRLQAWAPAGRHVHVCHWLQQCSNAVFLLSLQPSRHTSTAHYVLYTVSAVRWPDMFALIMARASLELHVHVGSHAFACSSSAQDGHDDTVCSKAAVSLGRRDWTPWEPLSCAQPSPRASPWMPPRRWRLTTPRSQHWPSSWLRHWRQHQWYENKQHHSSLSVIDIYIHIHIHIFP